VAVEAFTSAPRTLRRPSMTSKGSRDVVLVVADRLRSRARGAQGAIWSRPLLGEAVPAEDAEELRIAFHRPNPGRYPQPLPIRWYLETAGNSRLGQDRESRL
jgi:hypothetical protein